MSAVTPAPDEGSNPAIVSTTGGVWDIEGIYRKPRHLQNFLVPRRQRIIDSRALVLMAKGLNVQMGGLSRGLATRFFRSPIDRIRLAFACIYMITRCLFAICCKSMKKQLRKYCTRRISAGY